MQRVAALRRQPVDKRWEVFSMFGTPLWPSFPKSCHGTRPLGVPAPMDRIPERRHQRLGWLRKKVMYSTWDYVRSAPTRRSTAPVASLYMSEE